MGHLSNKINNNPYLGFSSHLLSTISECRGKVEQWVEREKQTADEMERKYNGALSQEQATIDELDDELLTLQSKLGINGDNSNSKMRGGSSGGGADGEGLAQRQKNLTEEKEQLLTQIAKFKIEKDDKDELVKRLQKQEEMEQARAADVRAKKRMAEESKNTTVEDLTKGIINYKYLGLDFEKAENQRLRFSFSQIDPDKPFKKFSFILGANDFNFYEIENCNPPIDHEQLLECLNSDDDLGQFVLGMRSAFVELVNKSKEE